VVFLYEYENHSHHPAGRRLRWFRHQTVDGGLTRALGGEYAGGRSANFNDKSWLDLTGDFHSDAMRIVERWTFVGADTISFEASFEDSKVFARPWKLAAEFNRVTEPDFELLEFACWEGERNAKSMLESRSKGKQ
jgi:hypothetical protein